MKELKGKKDNNEGKSQKDKGSQRFTEPISNLIFLLLSSLLQLTSFHLSILIFSHVLFIFDQEYFMLR
jgi:hypothetical protein